MAHERALPNLDAEIRQWIYQHFAESGHAPDLIQTASRFGVTLDDVAEALHRLQTEADALVLVPGTPYIWMAEFFSAVPTAFLVRSGSRQWRGNCIWDALAILALLDLDGTVSTACPISRSPLTVTVVNRALAEAPGIVHFAVPARDWWRDIGFT